ncbi:D-alanyl-D-alanine carboxypeptidase family protein [Paenibacillus sp. JCM 10914]|uniref:D-alanyl-D-alanine carboxypeptidase family protein n=1 Tax=Paenibacillus sp. JCM 10914 TaxID=1236974 RepID=UPI0003CC4CEE|nr:D-alanyl-D-alanine carboxypeptidase family protein [Paenibacillus sp. JCM 10914]GAE06711.1 D-alanyl-D-alanine carboxypeptidase [Paenibacillus sp. JCM 10914]
MDTPSEVHSTSTRKHQRQTVYILFVLILGIMVLAVYILNVFIPPSIKASSAILMHADTGKILYSRHADLPLPPASMSKMMTELLTLDAVSSGKRQWNDNVHISRYAAEVPGSRIGMNEGDTYTLKELFDALVVHSANDAAVAIAEFIHGSETTFVAEMNRRAKEIGLSSRTVFANASGLPAADLLPFAEAAAQQDTVMTARDAATLARWLMNHHPELLDVTVQPDLSWSQKGISLHTTNLMLPGEPHAYDGNDGFKTGYTGSAGYCFTGTASRNGSRLITVVMGTSNPDQRFAETKKLMDYGFNRRAAIPSLISNLF